MSGTNRTFGRFLIETVVIRTALVVGILVFTGLTLDRVVARKDLTEDERFTISEASHRMAAGLPDQLTIRAYFSQKLPEGKAPVYRQIMDILDEYRAASNGKIKIELFDPDTSTIHEKEAESYGIRPVAIPIPEATGQRIVNVYGSIVLLYRDRRSEVLNLAERYPYGYEGLSGLEYDISSRLWQLRYDKPTLGITGELSDTPQPNPMNPMGARPRPMFSGVRRLLGDAFEFEDVDLNQSEPDPAKIPCLLVVRPKEFNDIQQFRLDQYLMKGGRVIMFVTQGNRVPDRFTGQESFRPFETGLEDWLEFQGVRVPVEFVVHESSAYPMPVRGRLPSGQVVEAMVQNPFLPIITSKMEGCINEENLATQSLREVFFPWPHPVDIVEGRVAPDVKSSVLISSNEEESWRWKEVAKIDHRVVLQMMESGEAQPARYFASPLMVALEGKFTSYYANSEEHPVPPSLASGDEGTDAPGEKKEGEEDEPKGPEVVRQSGATQLVVVGNALFISDLVLGGQQLNDRQKQIAQAAFNLIDWLARSPELIKMRNKKFKDRALVDPVGEQLKEVRAELEEGKITLEEARDRLDSAKDEMKADRSRWRWRNVVIPCGGVLLLGLLVWIVRVGRRSLAKGGPGGNPEESKA